MLGVVCALNATITVDAHWLQFLPVTLWLAFSVPRLRCAACFISGVLWAQLYVEVALGNRLPSELIGRDMLVEGRIVSIPKTSPLSVRFVFDIERTLEPEPGFAGRVSLRWYESSAPVRAGDRWRFQVRLKPPRGYSNPGGFDYERWLFAQRIGAVGYVRQPVGTSQRLGTNTWSLQRWRQHWVEHLEAAIDGHPTSALVLALGLGHRDGVSETQREVLRRTGTAHLMAISGLHVGIVAGLVFALVGQMWRRSSGLAGWLATPRVAAFAALLAAAGYALAAGFSIPTQRALVMVAVVMLSIMTRSAVSPGRGLALAALAVVAMDPFALLQAGFWLSFVAVSIILLAASGTHGNGKQVLATTWQRWGRIHVVVCLGLAPLSLLYFDAQAVCAPIANLIAVPVVGVVVVPAILAGMTLLLLSPIVGGLVLEVAGWVLFAVWSWLEWLSAVTPLYQAPASVPVWVAVAMTLGLALAMLPAGVPGRWLGWSTLVLLFGNYQSQLPAGTLELTVLDVGQGLSVVARNEQGVVVYDTGPRYASGFNTGRQVVVPFLRTRGIQHINTLVVSHGDTDHAGGVASLLAAIPAVRIVSNVVDTFVAEPCVSGLQWSMGNTRFEVLAPALAGGPDNNNRSCVIRIDHPAGSVLLPGDIEAQAERQLLYSTDMQQLRVDVLVAPHHGSRTSSTPAFVTAVDPAYVVMTVGYRNRFGFPAADVLARYQRIGAHIYRSDRDGAVTFLLIPGAPIAPPQTHRQQTEHIWASQEF